MKIIYDNIIFSLQRAGGISVYWSELIKRILLDENLGKLFLESKLSKINLFRKQLDIPHTLVKIEKSSNQNYLRLSPVFYSSKEKYVFHTSYYRRLLKTNKSAVITTIHDFTPELLESGFSKKLLGWQKYYSMKQADGIICVSENTKQDLIKLYPEFENKLIEVIHNGVSEEFYPIENTESPELFDNNLPYCIFIGKREGYKNFEFTVDCLHKTNDLNLLIIGGGALTEIERKSLDEKIPNHYKHLSFIENSELNKLYNSAELMFYPSDYEGFGLPVIEAMKSGCPLIAQKTSSINELVENKSLLMENLSFDEFLKIRSYIEANRSDVISSGIENGRAYTWDNSYAAHLKFYEKVYLEKFGM